MIFFVDIDDTLIRSFGSKRIPMAGTVEHIKYLFESGAELYCWSSGGGKYAQESAEELEIAYCFKGFLPKPNVLIDDQPMNEWRGLVYKHPNSVKSMNYIDYKTEIDKGEMPQS